MAYADMIIRGNAVDILREVVNSLRYQQAILSERNIKQKQLIIVKKQIYFAKNLLSKVEKILNEVP